MRRQKHLPDLKKLWKARRQILEGVTNTVFKKEFIEKVAAYRKKICDKCKHNDGECEVPGSGPCCGACGCSLTFKLRALSSACGLTTLNKDPLWLPILSEEDEDRIIAEIEADEGTSSDI